MDERLQKVLARAGIASRRKAEELITKGRVSVDGRRVTELGTRVDPRRARVEVDGRRIVAEPLVYVAFHKPRAVMCTLRDPEGRPTVAEYLRGMGVRVYPVGRLDFQTSGVLLLTNDGEFSSVLQHPRKAAPKVYVAKVQGEVSDADLERWVERIPIDGRLTQPASVKRLRFAEGKTWLEITLREGRNRQVRRLGEHTGFSVMRLSRQSYAGITVEGLRPGQWRYLTSDELADLKKDYGVPKRVRAAPPVTATRRGPAPERRSTAERRPTAERRSGAERRPTAERRSGAERRPTAERRSGAEHRPTAERRSGADRRPAAERRPTPDRRPAAERQSTVARPERGAAKQRRKSPR